MAAVPVHERPRERILSQGSEALTDRELLAVVLRDGTRGMSALDLAGELLAEYGSLRAVASARPEELASRAGIGPAKASGIVAAFELGRRLDRAAIDRPVLRTPADVARVATPHLKAMRRERLLVLVCDAANRVMRTVTVSDGSMDRSLVPVREILNAVLRHDGRAFALAHNHPNGNPEPSDADRLATEKVKAAATVSGLRLLGHVVVAGKGWQAVS